MSELGDSSDVSDPVCYCLLKFADKLWILDSLFEVISRHDKSTVALELLIVLGSDLILMLEHDLRHKNVLLALNQVHLELRENFWNVVHAWC